MNNASLAKANIKKYGLKILAVCFWLLLWELLSRWKGNEIFLASPKAAFGALLELSRSLDFWQTILFSSLRIILGFVLALSAGIVLAIGSYQSILIRELIAPIMS